MGQRATKQAQTRDAIIRAAQDAYQELGIRGTSMQEVARRAHLSPATVLNHFPDPEELTKAVLARIEDSLEMPSPGFIEGHPDIPSRVTALSIALAEFYERSEPWYRIHAAERELVPVLAAAEARFYSELETLTRRALGPLGRRTRTVSAVMALTSPPVYGQLRAQGMSAAAAGRIVGDILAPWLLQTSEGGARSRSQREK